MLHLPETDLKKTRFYQDVFAEGREDGRREGRRTALVEVLAELVTARFGAPTPAVRERMEQADTETLMHWSKRLLTAASLAEVMDERH